MNLKIAILSMQLLAVAMGTSQWPYLHKYPPVNETDERTPLYFGLMLSTVSYNSIRGLPAIQIALDYINNDPTILPGYSLHYTLTDSKCNPSTTVANVFQQLDQKPKKLAWIGSGCLTATEYSAPLTQLYNITQISCTTSLPVENDRKKLRYYFQLQPQITILNRGIVSILNTYGWKSVGLIVWRNFYFSMIANHLEGLLAERNIEYTERYVSNAGFEVNGSPFDKEKRVYILIVASIQTRQLLCEAFRNGIQYPRTQFILIGEYADDWLRETNPARDLGCTLEERQLTLGYALTVNLPDQPENTNTIRPFGGLSAASFRTQFLYQSNMSINNELNLAEVVDGIVPYYSSSCYEATLALALALHHTNEDLEKDDILRREAGREVGISEEENFTLANFSYSNFAIVQRMFHHLNYTNFDGISGYRVQFDANGIRVTNSLKVSQYTRLQGSLGNFYSIVGSVLLLENRSDSFNIVGNLSESLYWPGGIPNDGTPVMNIVTISPAVTSIYSILSAVGIILALTCGIFNFVNRNKKLIRLSSPKLNYIIILGAIFFYISGLFIVLPSLDPDVIVIHCNLTPIIVFTGYSMCYGTILVKMFRVWYIFNNPSLQKKYVITDCYLIFIVVAFVGLDLFMMLTYITIQGFRNRLVASLTPEASNPRELVEETDIVRENYAYSCDTEGRGILILLLYISKLFLQIVALILAFRTRKVKVKGLDDSKYISAAIYITTIVLPVSIFASFTLRSHINAFPAVVGAAHYFGATAILLLVFVPRMVGLYKDPSGENVFQDKANTLGEEESNVMALRRDVQQLRVSLHLAQKKKRGTVGTLSTDEHLEGTPRPKKAIVKPCIRRDDTNDYVETTFTETNTDEQVMKKSIIVKPCLQLTGSSLTEDDDYVHARMVPK